MSAGEFSLESLLRASQNGAAVDRKALAGLLLEAARNLDRERANGVVGVKPADPRMGELRRLLVGGEINQIERLTRRVEDPENFAEAIGRVLPSAIAHAATRDGRLGEVLAPTVERATRASIRSDPRTLVNIIYPVIVPAIRKSIAETIDGTFQSLNETLKHSLSWRGLKWRIEAWRTGKSFAEVVLQNTLVYQVEHVFLIHRHTGLLIAHVTAEDAASQDPQLVSSMLVAIQDFVKDSFSGAASGLDALRLGDFLLWSEQGTYASLVAVIRGKPPESLHGVLREALAKIHDERAQALEAFDGDSTPFLDIHAELAAIVRLRQEAIRRGGKGYVAWLVTAGALALGVAGVWTWQQWRHERDLWETYVGQLQAEAGIAVTETTTRDGKWVIAGLRDPLAADPDALLRSSGLDPARVFASWRPYQALDAPIVLKRLARALAPPETVRLDLDGATIKVGGYATRDWIERAHATARVVAVGYPAIDLAGLGDMNDDVPPPDDWPTAYAGAAADRFARDAAAEKEAEARAASATRVAQRQEISELREAIQTRYLLFLHSDTMPAPGQDSTLDELAARLRELYAVADKLAVAPRITLTGHSDTTGRGALFNMNLSTARAEVVRALLRARGVDVERLAVRGAGPLEPLLIEASDADRFKNRRVSFSVVVDDD